MTAVAGDYRDTAVVDAASRAERLFLEVATARRASRVDPNGALRES